MWTSKKKEIPREPEVKAPPAPAPPKPIHPSHQGGTMTQSEPVRSTPSAERGGARLGPGLHVQGEISGNEDLQIDGTVEGHVRLGDRKLTIGATARVTADIQAREVVIYGNVKGNLQARDRIEIKKDGSVIGDLTTARIMIEDGAYFKGSIEIDRGASADASKTAAARPLGSPRPTAS
jgi:cytoskeletal protein CcmA (bactofilin family)